MSDDLSSPELPQVEPDLGRRVAWGLIAGRSKAEIAIAEDLTEEECRAVCAAPGMFAILNVWVNFLARRREAGKRNVRKLAGWAIEHIFTHAPERLSKSELWRLDRLSNVMLDYGFSIVFGWFLKHLDGVMGLPGAMRADLGPFRQNLVDLVAWAIETTLHDKLKEQFPAEYLAAKDLAFRRAIADREIGELGLDHELRTIEDVIAEYEAMAAAEAAAEKSVDTLSSESSTAGANLSMPAPPDADAGCSAPEAVEDPSADADGEPSVVCEVRPASSRSRAKTRRPRGYQTADGPNATTLGAGSRGSTKPVPLPAWWFATDVPRWPPVMRSSVSPGGPGKCDGTERRAIGPPSARARAAPGAIGPSRSRPVPLMLSG